MATADNQDEHHPANPPWIAIAPMRMELLEKYHACLDTVCREGRYLSTSCAPEIEKSRAFVSAILDQHLPMFVALIPGPKVIGWIDIHRRPYPTQQHVGVLGMGIHSAYREQGLGTLLMERALKKSITAGLERLELDVFSTNLRAKALYKKFDFEVEGTKRYARKTEFGYEDIIIMAKMIRQPQISTAITGIQI